MMYICFEYECYLVSELAKFKPNDIENVNCELDQRGLDQSRQYVLLFISEKGRKNMWSIICFFYIWKLQLPPLHIFELTQVTGKMKKIEIGSEKN